MGLAGCRGDGGPRAAAAPPDAAPAAPPAADDHRADPTVRIAIDSEPSHLNPDLDPDRWGYRIARAIYEPLWRPKPGGGFEGVLADRFTVEDDGRKITFHLRPGVQFHDGQPLHATDVVFTFDKIRAARARASRTAGELADLDHAELAGPETVRIWANRPSQPLLYAIADIGILPEHVFGRGDFAYQGGNRHPVGTGPYRMRSWERGQKIVLERFPRYWGPPAPAEAIEILVEPDPLRSLGEARRGEIDAVGRVPPAWVPEQLDSPNLRERYRAVRVKPARFSFVLWNAQRPPLDDAAVRRALSQAIDRARLVAEVRHGLGRPIAVPAIAGADGPPAPAFDPAAVEKALDAAGLPRAAEGAPRQRGGHPIRLTILVPAGSREAQETARRVEESLAKVGLPCDLVTGDLAVLMLRLKRGLFDGALLEWSGHDDDDLAPLFRARGAQNYGGYGNRAVDQLFESLRAPARPDERRDRGARLAAALADDPPALFLYAPEEEYLIARRLGEPPAGADFPPLEALRPGAE